MKAQGRSLSFIIGITLAASLLPVGGCKDKPEQPNISTPPPTATMTEPSIGGQKAIVLRRSRTGDGTHPEFLSVTVLPGRGMNVLQITAYLPGKGEVPLLASPSLDDAAKILNGGPDDYNGNKSFTMGGAFLFPFANRIVGPLSADKKSVPATWRDRTIQVLANWHGKRPGAPMQAMHGALLAAKADKVGTSATTDGAVATAAYRLKADGKDGNNWFSDNDVTIDVAMDGNAVELTLVATNTGKEAEPVGIGWHPYFQLPSGSRANARLHIPAEMRAEVNNYDDVFPTGKLMPVHGTPFDFTSEEGAPLPNVLVDDSFVHIERNPDGEAVSDLTDVGADIGFRLTAMSTLVRAFQVYSPLEKNFVVIEPQFNYGDPFGREWNGESTGMVPVEPGSSVTWKARLELFQPSQKGRSQPTSD